MNELEIKLVLKFIEDYLFEPTKSWPRDEFDERAYARWAAYEIVERLMDCPFDPPDLIIEEFMLELDIYSHQTKSEHIKDMFSIARDTALDILCLLT